MKEDTLILSSSLLLLTCPFVDSSDVIVPKRVEVVFPGETEPVTTLDVPGFRANSRETVTCTYVDPAGLMITLTGVR